MPITEGTRLDRYQILSPIGTGGMGEVYLAQDTRLGRKVAIKMLPAQYTQDTERLRRFEQEAFAASALNHPNIITIYEIGEATINADKVHFIVTEYIEGQTLRRRLAGGPLPIHEVLEISLQIAGALATAHGAGIIHRDLKPENLMIRPDGYVKMLDFGLAKLTEKAVVGDLADVVFDSSELQATTVMAAKTGDTASLGQDSVQDAARENDLFVTAQAAVVGETKPGVVMGTAQYMSPEQARGQRVDWRTDIFSFGIVLFEMLTGRAPFTGHSPKEIVASILQNEPPPLARYLPGAPESLEWIVSKALVKDREERYQSAREMLNDFKRLQRRLTVEREMSRQTVSGGNGVYGDSDGNVFTTEKHSPRSSGNVTKEFPAQTGVISNAQSSGIFAHLSGGAGRNRFFHPLFIALAATTLLAVGFSIYQFLVSRSATVSPFQSMQVRRFTVSGKAARAAISPDGKYVVHVSSDAGKQSLLVRQVTPSDNVVIVPPADVVYRGLTFSHDSTSVFYVVQEQRNDQILSLYQVPVLGGVARKILRDLDSAVAVSPDGKQLAFVRRVRGQGEDLLMLANSDGSNPHTLASRKNGDFFGLTGLDWSPDGKSIACPAGSNTGGRHMYVVEFNAATGQQRILSPQKWSNVGRVSWRRDGKGMVFTAIEQGSPLAQVWFLSYPKGASQRITNDLIDYRDTSLTDNSTALVTVQSEAYVNVWLAPVAAGFVSEASRARQITDGVGQRAGDRGLMWTPNGNLIFVSRASGSLDLWRMDQNGKNQQQLTTPETRAETYPAVSPDGRYVVFSSNRTGNSNIYRLDLVNGEQVQLTKGTSEEFPTITPDGKFVIYTLTSSSKFTLWKVPIDGGEPVQLTDKLSQWPVVSPDGQRLACWYRQEVNAPWQIAILPIADGQPDKQPEKLFDMPTTADWAIPIRWTPDGKGLGFVDTRSGVSNLWMLPLEGGEAKQLTNFSADQILWFDWSRDGKQLACSRGRVTNDVVLIEFK